MIALLISAVRARTAQAATVLVLTLLAVAAAVASPWYLLAASRHAAGARRARHPS